MTVGIICEYNPLHLGHEKQLRRIRVEWGQDTAIVCAMSGNFVQRGIPAIFDKSVRAEAAIRCGADLVVELPVTTVLSSAEGFAAGGVGILSRICDTLCFGTETGCKDTLLSTAQALLDDRFPPLLRQELANGISFPAARTAALEKMGVDSSLLRNPNDILGVEYGKAILTQGRAMDIFPIPRPGSYHAETPDSENPSATALRGRILSGESWKGYVPSQVVPLFASAASHSLSAGERAVLAKLRAMTDEEFKALPYGSEGLWRKLMHASRQENTLEDILTAVKSKRYTRTRLDRMVMCAFLGISAEMLSAPAPYARVLAFNDRGREILGSVKSSDFFRNAGEPMEGPYHILENRCGSLYGLFSRGCPESPQLEKNRRIRYLRD